MGFAVLKIAEKLETHHYAQKRSVTMKTNHLKGKTTMRSLKTRQEELQALHSLAETAPRVWHCLETP